MKPKLTLPEALMAFAVIIALPTSSRAVERVVPDDFPTIQSAIDAATSGDLVRVRDGTYVESLVIAGKRLVLFSDSGPDGTVLTMNAGDRIANIQPGADVTFSGFTFRGGRAARGGAILVSGARLALGGCVLTSNAAYLPPGGQGGALYAAAGAKVAIEACTFSQNSAQFSFDYGGMGAGGAIYSEAGSEVTASRSVFSSNVTAGFEGGVGGAVYANGRATFANSEFSQNFGDGAILSHGALTVRGCAFRHNGSAYGSGGINSSPGPGDSLEVSYCEFTDNNSLFEALIYAQGPSLIANNTCAFNTGSFTSVIEAGQGTITGNIIARTNGTGIVNSGPEISCNDVWESSEGNYSGIPDLTHINGNISADPRFCWEAVRDLRLHDTSPCAPGHFACPDGMGALPVYCTAAGVDDAATATPLLLAPIRPNPARAPIDLEFTLPHAAFARLELLDVTGRRIATIAEGVLGAGLHHAAVTSDFGHAPRAGVFFVRLTCEASVRTQRFVILD